MAGGSRDDSLMILDIFKKMSKSPKIDPKNWKSVVASVEGFSSQEETDDAKSCGKEIQRVSSELGSRSAQNTLRPSEKSDFLASQFLAIFQIFDFKPRLCRIEPANLDETGGEQSWRCLLSQAETFALIKAVPQTSIFEFRKKECTFFAP